MIITLSSYNDFEHHLMRDAFVIAFGNRFDQKSHYFIKLIDICIDSMTSILAGFVIFSYMGSVAYERKADISKVVTDGPGLAFIIYPEAVAKFPFGQIFSIVFFFMLILLGLGSQTPAIESIMSTIYDFYPKKRKTRPIILFLLSYVSFAFGLFYCTQVWSQTTFNFNSNCFIPVFSPVSIGLSYSMGSVPPLRR